MKRTAVSTIAILSALAFAPFSHAGGGGGGGGSGSLPSGPRYDPVVEYQNGVTALKAGEYAAAEKALKRVVKVAKSDPNANYALGLAHAGQEEWSSAARAFAKTLKAEPTHYAAHGELVSAYVEAGKASRADKAMAKLLEADASCAGTCPKAQALAAAKEKAEAAMGGETLSHLAPLPDLASTAAADALYAGAIRQINLGAYDAAIADLDRLHARFGPHPDVLTYLGFAHRKQGETEAALAYYAEALAVDPNHLSANEYLGEYHVERGDLQAARAQLRKLERLCPFGCAQTEALKAWIDAAEA